MEQKVFFDDELKNIISVVVGTRPGIIKFSPVIRALTEEKMDFFVIHTGQHYSYNMDKQFFEDLELPEPKYKNEVVQRAILHGEQTAEMIKEMEKAFIQEKPKIVIVGGDANTNLAGALAARKLRIKVAHMEAGLRSNDWRMPEEHNRVMIDHISEYLFTPTEETKRNLIGDNVKGEIVVVGNTIVDAVHQNLGLAKNKSCILENLNIKQNEYFLATAHREENVDNQEILKEILESFTLISREYNIPIIFPIHPRTKKRLKEFNLKEETDKISMLKITDPVGYLDFLKLMAKAKLVLTDSGGIQEETCILKVPCVTLRESTERPETVEVGGNIIAGTQPNKVFECVNLMLKKKKDWENPFGEGNTGKKIAKYLLKSLGQ